MTENELNGRFVEIPGVLNLRDAAIGPLRPGVLYRSGSFHQLTPEGARQLKALGLRTVVDLRSPAELAEWPDQRHGLDYDAVHLPTMADRHTPGREWPEGLAELYPFMAEQAGPSVAAVVRLLARADGHPLLLHCAVGKDRTGVTIAVLQSVLGVTDEEITADYLLSNANLGLLNGPVAYRDEAGVERHSRPVTAGMLHSALDRMRESAGSLVGWLHAHGVTEAELAALRATLLP